MKNVKKTLQELIVTMVIIILIIILFIPLNGCVTQVHVQHQGKEGKTSTSTKEVKLKSKVNANTRGTSK